MVGGNDWIFTDDVPVTDFTLNFHALRTSRLSQSDPPYKITIALLPASIIAAGEGMSFVQNILARARNVGWILSQPAIACMKGSVELNIGTERHAQFANVPHSAFCSFPI